MLGLEAFPKGFTPLPQAVPEGYGTELSQTDGINLQFRNKSFACQLVLVWQVTEEQEQSRDLYGHTDTSDLGDCPEGAKSQSRGPTVARDPAPTEETGLPMGPARVDSVGKGTWRGQHSPGVAVSSDACAGRYLAQVRDRSH